MEIKKYFKSKDSQEIDQLQVEINKATNLDPQGESETSILGQATIRGNEDNKDLQDIHIQASLRYKETKENQTELRSSILNKEKQSLQDRIHNLDYIIQNPEVIQKNLNKDGIEFPQETMSLLQKQYLGSFEKEREKLIIEYKNLGKHGNKDIDNLN